MGHVNLQIDLTRALKCVISNFQFSDSVNTELAEGWPQRAPCTQGPLPAPVEKAKRIYGSIWAYASKRAIAELYGIAFLDCIPQ